jgi:hypothetical protein
MAARLPTDVRKSAKAKQSKAKKSRTATGTPE